MSATKSRDRRRPAITQLTSGLGWPKWADSAATDRLRQAVRADSLGHAYLLTGPKGVGKRNLALAFAQALCCPKSDPHDRAEPCGACRACRNVWRDAHPDVEVFDLSAQAALDDKSARSETLSIDTVRRLRTSAALLPLEAPRRILIVDDAETLLEPAQQALLKTLEEPPRVVTLVLLADEPEALLATVRSRCQEIAVRPISEAGVRSALIERGVADDIAAEIASLSRGCPAWAFSAASDEQLLKARRDERAAAIAWIESAPYERLVTAFKLGEQFTKRRSDIIGIVQAATQHLRAEMIRTAADPTAVLGDRSAEAPDSVSAVSLSRAVAASLQCLADLEANVRPRLALEAMVTTWPNLGPRRA